jgi:hypothetical protein
VARMEERRNTHKFFFMENVNKKKAWKVLVHIHTGIILYYILKK